MGSVIQFSDSHDYDNDVKNITNDKVIFIKFTATWCGPCKKVSPVYESCAEQNSDHTFYEIDIDDFSDLQDGENVSSIPYFIAYYNGNKIDSLSGSNKESLVEFVKTNIDKLGGTGVF